MESIKRIEKLSSEFLQIAADLIVHEEELTQRLKSIHTDSMLISDDWLSIQAKGIRDVITSIRDESDLKKELEEPKGLEGLADVGRGRQGIEEGSFIESKLFCRECDWRGLESEVLTAGNPFDDGARIVGCPDCKEVESLNVACDEPDCWKEASCGTPTDKGYRRTCGDHKPS